MPNQYGIYTLKDMRDHVRRKLLAYAPTDVDEATGEETLDSVGEPIGTVDRLYSNTDLNVWINEAVTGYFVNMAVNSGSVWADEALIDIVPNRPEYSLPNDLCQLRGLYWKDDRTPLMLAPPSERTLMLMIESPEEWTPGIENGAPSYRRQLNNIVLGEPEYFERENTGGILVRYTKWINFLAYDEAMLETQFARVLQECVVCQATITALSMKANIDPPGALIAEESKWSDRLTALIRTSTNAPFIQMVAEHPGARR